MNLKLATEDSKTKKLWAATSWAEKKDFVKLSPLKPLALKNSMKNANKLEKTAIR